MTLAQIYKIKSPIFLTNLQVTVLHTALWKSRHWIPHKGNLQGIFFMLIPSRFKLICQNNQKYSKDIKSCINIHGKGWGNIWELLSAFFFFCKPKTALKKLKNKIYTQNFTCVIIWYMYMIVHIFYTRLLYHVCYF